MRYLFTLSVVLLTALYATAGDGGCGTSFPANHQLHSTAQERMNGIAISSRAGVRYVPVAYHIVSRTNGTGGISLRKVFETHCMLNIGFEQPQMYFYIFNIDTIKDDALYAMSDGQGGTSYNLGYTAFGTYNESSVVNVYITGALPGLCGFATFPGSAPNGGGLFLNSSCCGINQQTIPHEMGHYFNLPHTFQPTNPVEYVDGSNCATKGDGFCDTPADASDNRASCPYNGTLRDPHGDLYNPDETLFMSYFNDNCLSRFSPQEQAEMNSTLSTDRVNLLNGTVPDITPLDSAIFISPVPGDSTALGSTVRFKWHSVPGARYYLFHLQPNGSNLILADTVVTDTFFNSGGLQASKTYKYYVRAISFGNVCEGASPYNYIQTSLIKATFNVVSPSCPGEADALIGVNPSNGVPPYTLAWSNSQNGNTISNLSPGIYTVTITDNNGKVAVATVTVPDATPLTSRIDMVGNNLNAYGSGGTAPYTYAWSNGLNGQFNNNVPYGTYTVTVTDSRGCSSTQTLVISSTGANLSTQVAIRVFPNPAFNANTLNLQLTLNQKTEATIMLVNVNGQVVEQVKKEFEPGLSNTALNIGQLPAGVYFVQFSSAEIVKTERVSIMR